jgi:hypothetical protein
METIKMLKVGQSYAFEELEKFLASKSGVYLMVENQDDKSTAIMHVFGGNFCGDWLSGDGILFYNNGEQHSAEPHDEFKVLKIVEF